MNLGLSRKIFGMTAGDLHPGHFESQEKFLERMLQVYSSWLSNRPYKIFMPKPCFSNKVVHYGEDDESLSEFVIRTKGNADGAIVVGEKIAVGFFNADCPIVCLHQGNCLAVLHAGYRCLVREERNEPNIIEVAMRQFDPLRTKAWVGYGIGSCCWKPEYNDKPEIEEPEESIIPELLKFCLRETTTTSPFGEGQLTVDLYTLIEALLIWEGIPRKNIKTNRQCTCCAVKFGQLAFWSHTRFKKYGGVDGRNLSLAFLDRHVVK